ncbi:MAG: bifunctional cystathionine gamma-lyase/homocysteine desulfhydrase [Hydrogenibacillus schlegelii]|nr:bifunctional cystathionine gamma-lyase/homocysteine desulfhydrase [Hydrogenibacillus schlegelii]
MRLKTRLIHGGWAGDEATGAVNVPIYLSSTFRQDAPGHHRGYEYTRTGNPTRAALEAFIAELEGGVRGLAFASGMAALQAVMMLFRAGDHLIVGDDVYGGTYRLLARVLDRFGLEAAFVDVTRLDVLEAALQENTRAVLVESPTNPLLRIVDLEAVAAFCRRHGLLLIVDNTFMTPYWQNPLRLGADVVVHSATKYLSGHSDVLAGLVVVKDAELGERLHFLQNATGGVLGPLDAYLLFRGIRTLGVRMEAHERNAAKIARFLAEHPDVVRVHYPGLEGHPGHLVARRQARGFGGMISFEVESAERAERLVRSVRLFALAESLGGVESLISIPARMTHASIPPERRRALGITDGLVRLSVGIEDVDDLLEDLEHALRRSR